MQKINFSKTGVDLKRDACGRQRQIEAIKGLKVRYRKKSFW
jgi:hypothetical protein